jgi:uncharacterized protein YndB with AHSA1/START domain
MPTDAIELSRLLPASPEAIYAAWLDAAAHAAMTGSPATVEAAEVGGRFTAWNGYIDGSFIALEPGLRIVLSWRSDDFPPGALDSRLEVLLEAAPGGARITLRHTDLPEGHGPALLEGWDEFYLEPMQRFFGAGRKVKAKARPKVKAKAKAQGKVKARPRAKTPARRKARRAPPRRR